MRIAMIGCMVMSREISYLAARSPSVVRLWWLRQGLHDTPDILRAQLQHTIDEVERENQLLPKNLRFEAIVLAYGLCSNGVIDLRSHSLPVVVPRCDDCISLFLGSADRYRTLFAEKPGSYWYNKGWIEQAFTPSLENYAVQHAEYTEVYGEENAEFLMACNHNWMEQYKSCGFITCPLGDCSAHKAYAQRAAQDFGWEFYEIAGSMAYFEALVEGPWDDERFLVCPPQSCIQPDYSNRKFCSVPIAAE